MMPINNTTPQKSLRGFSINENKNDKNQNIISDNNTFNNNITYNSTNSISNHNATNRKRHHIVDDDNTFVPPALSAYSIALLNDKSSPSQLQETRHQNSIQHVNKHQKLNENQVTGIYEIDFPDSHLKNNLKNRLSVHFQRTSSSPLIPNKNHPTTNTKINLNTSHNPDPRQTSMHNLSNGSINEALDHSFNNLNNNNHGNNNNSNNYNNSLHNSFNMSTNNYTSTHNTTSDDPEDILDNSIENSIKTQPTSATTPGSSVSQQRRPSSSNLSGPLSGFNGPLSNNIKRSRLARRFRSLGPPKRASKSCESEINLSSDDKQPKQMNESNENNLKRFSHIIKTPSPPPAASVISSKFLPNINLPSNSPNSESKFFKALESLKSGSSENDLFSKQKEMELRKKIDEQKKLNELEHQLSKSKTIQSVELEIENITNNNKDTSLRSISSRDNSTNKESQFQVYSEAIFNNENKSNKENFMKNQNEIHNENQKMIQQPQRIPLNNVPVNTFNVFNEQQDNFRKPKLPKLGQIDKKEHQRQVHTSQPNDLSIERILHQQDSQQLQQPPQQASQQTSKQLQQATRYNPPDEVKKRKAITINGNQYEKLELLGRGGTSKVYKVKALFNNKLYAIKKVTFDHFEESCIKGFKGEIDLLLKLKNAERVVKLVDHAVGEGSVCLVMECGDIDLAHVFQNKLNLQNSTLDINFIRFHSIEILKCVEAVHKAEIVHSDLKPANFLFVKGMLKIIDFGIANAVPDHTANIYRESQIGTPNYMAPEALVETNQSFMLIPNSDMNKNNSQTWRVGKPSDVWSCGCIIYQMIYGKPPYAIYSAQQRIMAIMNPQVKIQYPSKGLGDCQVPISAIELMKKCLERSPNDRWTVDQCLNSDFLNPKIVSETFIRDLVHLAVNFGYNNHDNDKGKITDDVYDKLVDTVIKQIEDLHYA